MPFDARAAKLLSPGQHIIVEETPGLRLEATASSRTWTYRYKSPVDGRMRQVAVGHWPAKSHAAATVEWEQLRAKRDAGIDPSLERRKARADKRDAPAPAGGLTVRALCEHYDLGHLALQRQAKGRRESMNLLETAIEPIADVPAAELTRAQAFEIVGAYADRGASARRLRSELGSAWDYAIDSGKLPENTPNWWRRIMRGKLRSKGKKINGKHVGTAKRVLTQAETGELINWLPNFSRLLDDALVMYLWTGTRGAEIVAMESSEVKDEDDGLWWTIPKAKTKNARHEHATDLRVPLVGRAEVVVRRRLQVHKGWLFPAEGVEGHVNQKTISTDVYKRQPYCETLPLVVRPRLTVTHWAPHDLRRTARTILASLGCPDEVGEAILGHMPPGIKGIYNLHAYDRERRHWLTKLDARLEALAKKHLRRR